MTSRAIGRAQTRHNFLTTGKLQAHLLRCVSRRGQDDASQSRSADFGPLPAHNQTATTASLWASYLVCIARSVLAAASNRRQTMDGSPAAEAEVGRAAAEVRLTWMTKASRR
jgi:hypothetical protein